MEIFKFIIVFIWITTSSSCAGVIIPFTHDFNEGVYSWRHDTNHWKYSREKPPNTSNVPSFYSDGTYFWTDMSTRSGDKVEEKTELYSPPISTVTTETKFHFSYWFYTSKPNSTDSVGIYFDQEVNGQIMSAPKPILAINTSRNDWVETTIDCQHHNCCLDGYNCTIGITIWSSFDSRDWYSFTAFRCVSTEENECSRPHKSTSAMTNKSLRRSTVAKPSFANTAASIITDSDRKTDNTDDQFQFKEDGKSTKDDSQMIYNRSSRVLNLIYKVTVNSKTVMLNDTRVTGSDKTRINWWSCNSYSWFMKSFVRLFLRYDDVSQQP